MDGRESVIDVDSDIHMVACHHRTGVRHWTVVEQSKRGSKSSREEISARVGNFRLEALSTKCICSSIMSHTNTVPADQSLYPMPGDVAKVGYGSCYITRGPYVHFVIAGERSTFDGGA